MIGDSISSFAVWHLPEEHTLGHLVSAQLPEKSSGVSFPNAQTDLHARIHKYTYGIGDYVHSVEVWHPPGENTLGHSVST